MDKHRTPTLAGSPPITNAITLFSGTGVFNICHGTTPILITERGSSATASEEEQQPNRPEIASRKYCSTFSRSREMPHANLTDGSVHDDTRCGYLPLS